MPPKSKPSFERSFQDHSGDTATVAIDGRFATLTVDIDGDSLTLEFGPAVVRELAAAFTEAGDLLDATKVREREARKAQAVTR